MGVRSGTNFIASLNCLWSDLCLPFFHGLPWACYFSKVSRTGTWKGTSSAGVLVFGDPKIGRMSPQNSSLRGSLMGSIILMLGEGEGALGYCRRKQHRNQMSAYPAYSCWREDGNFWGRGKGVFWKFRGKLSVHNTEVSLASVIQELQHENRVLWECPCLMVFNLMTLPYSFWSQDTRTESIS